MCLTLLDLLLLTVCIIKLSTGDLFPFFFLHFQSKSCLSSITSAKTAYSYSSHPLMKLKPVFNCDFLQVEVAQCSLSLN